MNLYHLSIKIKESEIIDNFEEKQYFSIQPENAGHIFEILRSKLYSNPIEAIVRELFANAVDAHVVAKKKINEIQINPPCFKNPNFVIRDYGKGLSNKEMGDIFISFGASSKRSNNKEIGGFGIGVKTPFYYAESFTVVSYNGGLKTTYLMYLEASRRGAMSVLSKEESQEPSGLEIIVPVQEGDFDKFKLSINKILFWVGVKFDGFDSICEKQPDFRNDEVDIFENSRDFISGILMGGIFYSIPPSFLKEVVSDFGEASVIIKCKIGDFEVSANREGVIDNEVNREKFVKILKRNAPFVIEYLKNKLDNFNCEFDKRCFAFNEKLFNFFFKIPAYLRLPDSIKVRFGYESSSWNCFYFYKNYIGKKIVLVRKRDFHNYEKTIKDNIILFFTKKDEIENLPSLLGISKDRIQIGWEKIKKEKVKNPNEKNKCYVKVLDDIGFGAKFYKRDLSRAPKSNIFHINKDVNEFNEKKISLKELYKMSRAARCSFVYDKDKDEFGEFVKFVLDNKSSKFISPPLLGKEFNNLNFIYTIKDDYNFTKKLKKAAELVRNGITVDNLIFNKILPVNKKIREVKGDFLKNLPKNERYIVSKIYGQIDIELIDAFFKKKACSKNEVAA